MTLTDFLYIFKSGSLVSLIIIHHFSYLLITDEKEIEQWLCGTCLKTWLINKSYKTNPLNTHMNTGLKKCTNWDTLTETWKTNSSIWTYYIMFIYYYFLFNIPNVVQTADDVASLIGLITGCLRASVTFSWIPETMLPSICIVVTCNEYFINTFIILHLYLYA